MKKYSNICDELVNSVQYTQSEPKDADMAKETTSLNMHTSAGLYLSPAAKEALQSHEEYIINSSNPKWHRTKEEQEMRSNFHFNNDEIIEKYEKLIHNNAIAFNKDIDCVTRINSCKKSIQAFYDFKEYCYKTPEGTIYFQDMWEHCHNSKNECFAYVDRLEKILEYLEDNRTLLLNKEKKLPTLKDDLIIYLEDHSPILQKELYSKFNPLMKYDIQQKLRELESENIISRTKKNGTYEITLN